MIELMTKTEAKPTRISERVLSQWKQRRENPLMVSDWNRTVMIHYAVNPKLLQPQIPFPLDLYQGMAYVSLVAFTLRNLRPALLPARLAPLCRVVSEHGFLNVRTYVKQGRERGIYFLAEWLPNRLSILFGPPMYGLPYRYGKLDYHHHPERGELHGQVVPADESAMLDYESTDTTPKATGYQTTLADTLDEFLLERYIAWTERRGVRRRFDIWHQPWPQKTLDITVNDDSLVYCTGPWFHDAELAQSHYSPGVKDVWIGRPKRLPDFLRGAR